MSQIYFELHVSSFLKNRSLNVLCFTVCGLMHCVFVSLQDNINVFLDACKKTFGLNKTQLFDPGDLEDLSQRAIADE